MSKIIGIDPGTTDGAFVVWNPDERKIEDQGMLPNDQLLEKMRTQEITDDVAVEVIRGYGLPVGNETFDTCQWTGRLQEICHLRQQTFTPIGRKEVVKIHCGTASGKDKDIRAAMLQKVGPQGNKKAPGPTYNMSTHLWAALAVAVAVTERREIDAELKRMDEARANLAQNRQTKSVL